MKIDFELLGKLVDAGASGAVVLAFLREKHDRKAPRRVADVKRKRAEKVRKDADQSGMGADSSANTVRDEASLTDTPRARLFREAKPALLTLGIANSRAGALIVGWLKLTNDDDQLVIATILRAQSMAVADAPSWILATLKGKLNERGGSLHPNSGAQQSGSTAVLAGVAAAAERRARERGAAGQPGPQPGNDDSAERPDPELFGAQ